MSTLKTIFDNNGWAKVEMGAFVYLDDSCCESAKDNCVLSIYYVKLMDNRICKVTTGHDYRKQKINLFSYRYDILRYDNLEFDSDMINCGRSVLDDFSKYADFYNPRPEIRILESGKIYYDKAILCFTDILPDEITRFVANANCFENAV